MASGSGGSNRKRPTPQATLFNFFAKKKNGSGVDDVSGSGDGDGGKVAVEMETALASVISEPHAHDSSAHPPSSGGGCFDESLLSDPVAPVIFRSINYDIGHNTGIGKKRPDNFTLYKILTAEQVTLDVKGTYQSHLTRYKGWLVYSPLKEGLFCKFCPFFVPGGVQGGVTLQKLVTEPANNYAKILGVTDALEAHLKTS